MSDRILHLDNLECRLNDVVKEVRRIREVLTGLRECFGPRKLDLAGMTLTEIQDEAIRTALEITGGNKRAAAELLGIGERTIYRRLKAMSRRA